MVCLHEMSRKDQRKALLFFALALMLIMALACCIFSWTAGSGSSCHVYDNCADCTVRAGECMWIKDSLAIDDARGECQPLIKGIRTDPQVLEQNPRWIVDPGQCYHCRNQTTVEACQKYAPLCTFCRQTPTSAQGECIFYNTSSFAEPFEEQCPFQDVGGLQGKSYNVIAFFGAFFSCVFSVVVLSFILLSRQKRQNPINTVMAGFALATWVLSTGTMVRFFMIGDSSLPPDSFWHYDAKFLLVAGSVINLASLLYTYVAMWLCINFSESRCGPIVFGPRTVMVLIQSATVVSFFIALLETTTEDGTRIRDLAVLVPATFTVLSLQVIMGCCFVWLVARKVIDHKTPQTVQMVYQRGAYLGILFIVELAGSVLTFGDKMIVGEMSVAGQCMLQAGINCLPILTMAWFLSMEQWRYWVWLKCCSGVDPNDLSSGYDPVPLNKKLHELTRHAEGTSINSGGSPDRIYSTMEIISSDIFLPPQDEDSADNTNDNDRYRRPGNRLDFSDE